MVIGLAGHGRHIRGARLCSAAPTGRGLHRAGIGAAEDRQRPGTRAGFAIALHVRRVDMASKNTICLWYDGAALDAARFYAETFPGQHGGRSTPRTGRLPDGQGGQRPDGGIHRDGHTVHRLERRPALSAERSLLVPGGNRRPGGNRSLLGARSSATADRRASAGGARTGGGLSWQITPRALIAAISDPDPAAAQRAFAAMMGMGKIDVAAIQAARRG